MPGGPVPENPGRDDNPPGAPPEPAAWEPVITRPDPMTDQEWQARLEHEPGQDEDPEEYQDEDDFLCPGELDLTDAELAEIRAAAELAASDAPEVATPAELARAAGTGRRGPGQPGSARSLARQSFGPAAAFGAGLCLDVMPACPDLAVLADQAAGRDDSYAGVSDDELTGVLCAWDRLEAHMAARKLAAAAELSRRRPASEPDSRYAEAEEDFPADELAQALAESRRRAGGVLTMAEQLHALLPGTRAALRDGVITVAKAQVIAAATALLDEDEAAAAEEKVLGQVTLDSLTTENCDHRFEARGHDPGARLRHLAQVRHATCVSPVCRRPASTCDYEHNIPYEAGGRTCLCNGGPKCRHDHRVKQHPRWNVDQLPDRTFRWTTPSGRTYTTEPTRYPI